MPQYHDTFLLEVTSVIISAGISVNEGYEDFQVTPSQKFTVLFTYNIGRPKATADFTYTWLDAGGGSIGPTQRPSGGVFDPIAPATAKTVDGRTVGIGPNEQLSGTFTARAPALPTIVKGRLHIHQPD